MHPTINPAHSDDAAASPAPAHSRGRTRLIVLFTLLLILVSIAVLPPLVNVSRFQKRIARNISAALGRPAYFDKVTLVLFPWPGFTLDNFVLEEDPAFGYEPILRADQVELTLRLPSLFRRRTEFSKIAFSSPSVNLVYANGRWNIESLLLQAAHLQAAPTAQRFAGPARRFPYIEATGARLNLKLGQEKSALSLTDADFALWLPEPHQWRLRLEAHPMRTDTVPGDTGTLRAEGTLGGADANNAVSLADVPLDLQGDWRNAQLGGLSRLLFGRDPGLRGDFALAFALRGTVGHNAISANLKLADARRADFVPEHPLSLEASCDATSANTFRAFPSIACHWPPAGSSDPPLLALTASIPDADRIDSASATLTLPSIPADTFFDWLSIATPHPPAVLAGVGTFSGSLIWGTSTMPAVTSPSTASAFTVHGAPTQAASPHPTLSGQIAFTGGSLQLDPAGGRALALGDVILTSTPSAVVSPSRSRKGQAGAPAPAEDTFVLKPLLLDLGGNEPATFTARFDATGYTLHLTGTALPSTLRDVAHAVPQFGDNLSPLLDQLAPPNSGEATASSAPHASRATSEPDSPTEANAAAPEVPIPIDLGATRLWGGPQIWTTPQTRTNTSAHR